MATDQPYPLDSPHADRMEPTDGLEMATGVIVGVVIGLGFWLVVLVLAVVIA